MKILKILTILTIVYSIILFSLFIGYTTIEKSAIVTIKAIQISEPTLEDSRVITIPKKWNLYYYESNPNICIDAYACSIMKWRNVSIHISTKDTAFFKYTIIHEIGHIIWMTRLTQEDKEVWERSFKLFGSITKYGSDDVEEDFAEYFAFINEYYDDNELHSVIHLNKDYNRETILKEFLKENRLFDYRK